MNVAENTKQEFTLAFSTYPKIEGVSLGVQ